MKTDYSVDAYENDAFITGADGHDVAVLKRLSKTPDGDGYQTESRLNDDQWQEMVNIVAAAPELLAALKMAAEYLKAANIDEAMAGEFEIITDAIAKAEGRPE